jgi:hypothetical protein
MTSPSWLDGIFAAAMVAVAVYSAGRLLMAHRWARPTHRDVDVAHILMGTAMAGMLVSALNPIPSGAWEFVFSVLAAWFIWRCYQFVRDPNTGVGYDQHVHRLSRRLIHLVMALAMLYMFLAAVPAAIGSGGSMAMGTATGTTANFVLLPLAFVVALFASAIWEVDRIGRLSPSDAAKEQVAQVFAPIGAASPTPSEDSMGTDESIHRGSPAWLAPRLEAGAHIVMCVTMGYMLILML